MRFASRRVNGYSRNLRSPHLSACHPQDVPSPSPVLPHGRVPRNGPSRACCGPPMWPGSVTTASCISAPWCGTSRPASRASSAPRPVAMAHLGFGSPAYLAAPFAVSGSAWVSAPVAVRISRRSRRAYPARRSAAGRATPPAREQHGETGQDQRGDRLGVVTRAGRHRGGARAAFGAVAALVAAFGDAVNISVGAGCSGLGTVLLGTWIHDTTVPSLYVWIALKTSSPSRSGCPGPAR